MMKVTPYTWCWPTSVPREQALSSLLPLSESVHPGPLHTSVTCDFLSSEKATDGSLQSEDWALNMEICDIINETEEG